MAKVSNVIERLSSNVGATKLRIPFAERVSIDVSEDIVRGVKTNGKGLITGVSSCVLSRKYDAIPNESDTVFVGTLTDAIIKVKKALSLPRTTSKPQCTVVIGGSHVVLQRFTWPSMPAPAIQENVMREIGTYLPESHLNYSISFEILRKEGNDGTSMIDVLATACPKGITSNIYKAVTNAGFNPLRFDVRENVRSKMSLVCATDMDKDSSFALLDLTRSLPNITLYVKGLFYSSRYFGAALDTPSAYDVDEDGTSVATDEIKTKQEGIDELNRLASSLGYRNADSFLKAITDTGVAVSETFIPPEDSGTVSRSSIDTVQGYDVNVLTDEIVSIIDYISYQERGSAIGRLIILGDTNKYNKLVQSLKDSLSIPVHASEEWIKNELANINIFDIHSYLDAFGGILPSATAGKSRINLNVNIAGIKTKRDKGSGFSKENATKSVAIAMAVLLGISIPAIGIPSLMMHRVNRQQNILQTAYENLPVSALDMGMLEGEIIGRETMIETVRLSIIQTQLEIENVELQLSIHDTFYEQWPHARQMIPTLIASHIISVGSLSAVDGEIAVAGAVQNFNGLADFIDNLRNNALVSEVEFVLAVIDVEARNDVGALAANATGFSMRIELAEGMGVR